MIGAYCAPSRRSTRARDLPRSREIAQQATENRLRAVLDAYHPAPLHLFSTLDRDITLDFLLDYPTPGRQALACAVPPPRKFYPRRKPVGGDDRWVGWWLINRCRAMSLVGAHQATG